MHLVLKIVRYFYWKKTVIMYIVYFFSEDRD